MDTPRQTPSGDSGDSDGADPPVGQGEGVLGMDAMPKYHGTDELDSGSFGEVLAREVVLRIPGPYLHKLLNVGTNMPDLFLERLVAACQDSMPVAVEAVVENLKAYASCYDCDSSLVSRVIEQLQRECELEIEEDEDL